MVARWFGINPPFFGGAQNILSRQEDERLIKNDILQLIMTLYGERVHRPDFGSKLRAFVFETASDDELDSLALDIRRAIENNEERVTVNSVLCTAADDGQSVIVRIDVVLVNQPLTKYFIELSYNQNGSVSLTK